ncbi:hypothetical protein BOTU111921_11235 [Bordetella tumbae]
MSNPPTYLLRYPTHVRNCHKRTGVAYVVPGARIDDHSTLSGVEVAIKVVLRDRRRTILSRYEQVARIPTLGHRNNDPALLEFSQGHGEGLPRHTKFGYPLFDISNDQVQLFLRFEWHWRCVYRIYPVGCRDIRVNVQASRKHSITFYRRRKSRCTATSMCVCIVHPLEPQPPCGAITVRAALPVLCNGHSPCVALVVVRVSIHSVAHGRISRRCADVYSKDRIFLRHDVGRKTNHQRSHYNSCNRHDTLRGRWNGAMHCGSTLSQFRRHEAWSVSATLNRAEGGES